MDSSKITVIGIIILAFAINIIGVAQEEKRSNNELVDDIQEYNGSIGPENSLYGLKLAFEMIDESFTLNISRKLEKKLNHAKIRLSEAKAELKEENEDRAEKVLELYREKLKETEDSIQEIEGTDSGIANAQDMIKKNQYVLERLLELHPNNTGLARAYNNSHDLENEFERKIEGKSEDIEYKNPESKRETKPGDNDMKRQERNDRKDD